MHKYERVRDALSETLEHSAPGTQIPTEKELAEQFGVSAMTVRRALQILTEAGRLRGIPGRGTFVAAPRVTKMMSASNSFSDAMKASGRTPGSQLVEATMRPAGREEAERLQIPEGGLIFTIQRVRLGDGTPLGFESATLNASLLPGLLAHDLRGSLYETIALKYHLDIKRTGLVVSARLPTPYEAELLEIGPGTPCLQTVVTSQTGSGSVLEHTTSLFRGDLYEVGV